MFTGIVSHLGRVVELANGRLAIQHDEIAPALATGGSVAVNGVCLTVTATTETTFKADVVPETARRTNLGALQPGDEVNLELPLPLGGAVDGHLVQGHVDATTEVTSSRPAELGVEVEFALPDQLTRYVAEKGSITVDGASLTVAAVDDARGTFAVALIPHTLEHTVARHYAPGRLVNLEADVVARYVERLLKGPKST
jgi:riboflavin synthase